MYGEDKDNDSIENIPMTLLRKMFTFKRRKSKVDEVIEKVERDTKDLPRKNGKETEG